MLTTPWDVLTRFPVRKTKAQKQAFRESVAAYAAFLGWQCREESGSFGAVNLIIGDPEQADYLITAHYDTPARIPVPNFITPCALLPYVGYQLLLILGIGLICTALCMIPALLGAPSWVISAVSVLSAIALLALMMLGPANPSNANDNTSGVITLLETLRSFPDAHRHKVCFVLFDLEEAGLIGSTSYRKAHRSATDRQLILNLDCVGEGDEIRFFPNRSLKRDSGAMAALYRSCGYWGSKSLLVADKGFSFYPSDQMQFPRGVGIAALKKGKHWLYLDRIHTAEDTCLDRTNVNILRSALTSLVTCGAVKKG